MSQRRQKKQLSTLDNVSSLTDHELREALKSYSQNPGPITESTRNIYRKKLASLLEENSGEVLPSSSESVKVKSINLLGDDDDDDTSDEDYNVQDEESEDDDDDFDDDSDENVSEDEDLLEGHLNEDIKLSSTTTDTLNSTALSVDATPNRISKGIIAFLVAFVGGIFSAYLFMRGDIKSLVSLDIFTNVTKNLLILVAIASTALYVGIRSIRYYNFYRRQEMQRVCDLVSEALELLQSPDNPKSSLPILHIRDTLLTPAERKTKKMSNLWTKTVKFIEEHESRVKVELVNIDGEDFRAWKWIGSTKL